MQKAAWNVSLLHENAAVAIPWNVFFDIQDCSAFEVFVVHNISIAGKGWLVTYTMLSNWTIAISGTQKMIKIVFEKPLINYI